MITVNALDSLAYLPQLQKALGEGFDEIRAELIKGAAQLALFDDGTRVIFRDENPELVIVALEGQALGEKVEQLVDIAKHNQFSFIRFHTRRPALCRLLGRVQNELFKRAQKGEFVYLLRV